MPELPEVETVRGGLQRFVVGRTIASVDVGHPRAVRRHFGGAIDFSARLAGARVQAASRRGKYLWLPLQSADGSTEDALIAHLGMSGQLLVQAADAPSERHLHARFRFLDAGSELRFVDQRTFGGLMLDRLVACADAPSESVPSAIAHIARDPMDPRFDDVQFLQRLRQRRTEVKRALLDQSLVSGIGNIYADESLWRAKLNGLRLTGSLSRPTGQTLLAAVREVLGEALTAGGTSFDSLYVNVNGEKRLLRSLAGRVRPRRRAVPAVWPIHPQKRLHESFEFYLSTVSTDAADVQRVRLVT